MKLKESKPIVEAAVKNSWRALEFCPDSHKKDRDIAIAAVTSGGRRALEWKDGGLPTEKLWSDKEVARICIEKEPGAIQYAGENVRADKKIAMIAIEKDGLLLKYLADALKRDEDIVMMAVTQNGAALDYAAPSLQRDEELVKLSEKGKAAQKERSGDGEGEGEEES